MGSRRIPQSGDPGSRSLTLGRIGIVAALTAEARTLGRAVRSVRELGSGRGLGELRSLRDGSLLAVSGMGFEAAERSALALINAGCTALVSWGLAGGLDPALSSGMIALPAVLMLGGAPDLNTSPAWRAQVVDVLRRPGFIADGGKLLTSRRALAGAAEKRKAFLETGAIAVDMESYAIGSVASARGFPFIALRVIVDAAKDEVPAFLLDAADSRGRIAAGRLLTHILVSPQSLASLLRLARRYRVARRSLSEAARVFAGERP